MDATTVDNACLIKIGDGVTGNLSIALQSGMIPFAAKSIFCIYGVPAGRKRGEHAHERLHEFILAVKGGVTIRLFDGERRAVYRLDNPACGLYIPAGLWLELEDFTADAVCVVLASEKYEETDYIRLLKDFTNMKTKKV